MEQLLWREFDSEWTLSPREFTAIGQCINKLRGAGGPRSVLKTLCWRGTNMLYWPLLIVFLQHCPLGRGDDVDAASALASMANAADYMTKTSHREKCTALVSANSPLTSSPGESKELGGIGKLEKMVEFVAVAKGE